MFFSCDKMICKCPEKIIICEKLIARSPQKLLLDSLREMKVGVPLVFSFFSIDMFMHVQFTFSQRMRVLPIVAGMGTELAR